MAGYRSIFYIQNLKWSSNQQKVAVHFLSLTNVSGLHTSERPENHFRAVISRSQKRSISVAFFQKLFPFTIKQGSKQSAQLIGQSIERKIPKNAVFQARGRSAFISRINCSESLPSPFCERAGNIIYRIRSFARSERKNNRYRLQCKNHRNISSQQISQMACVCFCWARERERKNKRLHAIW